MGSIGGGRFDDLSPVGYEREVLCELAGVSNSDAPEFCDSLMALEWNDLKGRVIETAKLWKVIDECATYLGKRHIQDAMYSADFIEFAGLSGEIHEFSGDILEALSTEECIKRCRKKQITKRHAAMLAQAEKTEDIPHYRIEFIRGDMRSKDEIEQLDRIEILNEVTGVKK